jgi:Flp pilus assembly CpaE family ATPase
MSDLPTVVLALSPPAERRLQPLLFGRDAPLQLLATALDADELLDKVKTLQPHAVLISPDLSRLTAGQCERIRAVGSRLVGVAIDARDDHVLDELAVDAKIDPFIACEALLDALRGADDPPPAPASTPPTRVRRSEDAGSVVAVIGSKGAPGSSECAASLAALATDRWETLLVETDALGGGLALRLGADPNDGSILGLIRATQAGDGAVRELLERWRVEREDWPDVLLGAPEPETTDELSQPGAVTHALDALAETYPLVVCDVGFPLADTRVPAARMHREVIVGADAVVVVLGSSEAQLRQGRRQLGVILQTLAIPPERLRILVNGVGGPSSAVKDAINATIAEQVSESGVTVDAWAAWDARGARKARHQGLPIALAHRHGRYARAITGLLNEMFLPDETGTKPRTRRRKRRLAIPVAWRGTQRREPYEQEEGEVALPWQT